MDSGSLKQDMKRMVAVGLALFTTPLISCAPKNASFDLLNTNQVFQQNSAKVNNQIDILWVVDNSGSMGPIQANVVANFNRFMSSFVSKGFDYKIAVTTSDSYLGGSNYWNLASQVRVRDGVGTHHSGYQFITPSTPDLINTFVTNATQGANGSGDERVFQSLLETLKNPINSDFLRPDSFKAVIIVSDEDDFSDDTRPEGSGGDHNYSAPGLWSIAKVIADLDVATGSVGKTRNYNVSAITVMDDACRTQHANAAPSTIKGTRYMQLVNQTNGVLGSICDASYADSLNFIQQRIIELSTRFPIQGSPNPSTIQVFVDGLEVVTSESNGWTYESTSNSIVFHGSSVPNASAQINVAFDPIRLN